jgi:hypothetical protein
MVFCIECSRESKEQLDELVASGNFTGLSEVVAVAIANQLVLSKSAGSAPVIVGPTGSDSRAAQTRTGHSSSENSSSRVSRIPSLFLLSAEYRREPVALPPKAIHSFRKQDRISQAHWIFGQHNKLLPAKVSCRALANLLHEAPAGLEVGEAARKVANHAADLGAYLQAIDERFNRVRDEMLSTAFPGRSDPDKGRIRYANQFVSGITKKGQLTGLLVDLGLLNSLPTENPKVSLTEAGWEFALMPSPVLDGQTENPPTKFSPAERAFLAEHIANTVIVERSAYLQILNAIHEGYDSPEKLRAAFNSVEKETPKNKLYFSTQRAGAVSRMVDLGLLRRDREGTRVKYGMTDDGVGFLNNR